MSYKFYSILRYLHWFIINCWKLANKY